MENISIRKVTINDLQELQQIGSQTFIHTYASHNTEENMRNYLEANFSTKSLHNQLNTKGSEFYFAKLEHNTIGYLKLNAKHPKPNTSNELPIEIERIYVVKDYQGKSIGRLLLQQAIDISKQKHADFLWLGVWDENVKAIQFYKKNDFVEYDRHVFKLGDDVQSDIIMRLDLK